MSNKKETIEEAAESNFDKKTSMIPVPTSYWMDSKLLQIQNFEEGAKWQQNKMYSEEDVVLILEFARKNFYDTGTKWHQEPYIDLTSQELIKKYHEQK